MLLLDPTPFARGLVRKKVEVVNYPDGRFAVQFEGISLPFRVFDKIQTVRTWRDRGEQTVGRGAGVGEGAAGGLRATSAPPSSRAAAAAEQSGGAGHADKETAVAPRGRRGVGRTAGAGTKLTARSISIVQRYVTENDDAERP